MLLVQLFALLCEQISALGNMLNVGPKVEFAKNNIRLMPKRVRKNHLDRPPITPVPPLANRTPIDKKESLFSTRIRSRTLTTYESFYTHPSRTKINRVRNDTTLVKKVESTLLYKPKFPAHPHFKMCHFKDFDVSQSVKLGKGGFGNVFLGQHRETGTAVALKLTSHTSIKKSPKHVEFEETIHGRLFHPFIARFYCTMADQATSDVYFVLEYVPGNTLAKRISISHPIQHKLIQRWTAQILLALEYLHDSCIVYRDLKAENVIIDEDDQVKLIDFGLSVYDCKNELKSVAGTLEYTAPEMASRKLHGRAVDHYGLGVLVYTMKTGRLPLSFKTTGMEKKQYLKYIAEHFTIPKTQDPLYDDLISRLCDKNPETRWGLSEETRVLLRQHRFFQGLDWNDLEALVKEATQYEFSTSGGTEPLKNPISLDRYILSGDIFRKVSATK